MNVKSEILQDIKTTLNLLERYADKNKVSISPIISSIVASTQNKNLIDLYVIREFVKDKTSAILAADLDAEAEQMSNDTDGLDFNTGDMDAGMPESQDQQGQQQQQQKDPKDKEKEEAFKERKQTLLDSAEGYIQAIDLGIDNIQNGDVDLGLVGKLIDLKMLVQNAVDKVNEAKNEETFDDSSLNVLEAIINSFEPSEAGSPDMYEDETDENNEADTDDSDDSDNEESEDEGKQISGSRVPDGQASGIEGIIKGVSSGAINADTQISDLIDKINEIVDHPEQYAKKLDDEETSEDADLEDEDLEDGEKADSEDPEDKKSKDSEETEDEEESDETTEDEETDDDDTSPAEDFVADVNRQDGNGVTGEDEDDEGAPITGKGKNASKKLISSKAVTASAFDDDFDGIDASDTEGYEYDYEAMEDELNEGLDDIDEDDPFAFSLEDMQNMRAFKSDAYMPNQSPLLGDSEDPDREQEPRFPDDDDEGYEDYDPNNDDFDPDNPDLGDSDDEDDEDSADTRPEFEDVQDDLDSERPDDLEEDEEMDDIPEDDENPGFDEDMDETTPYVNEIEDVDFDSGDIPDKYEDPEERKEEEEYQEGLETDIQDLKDTFASKLDELENKYATEEKKENEKGNVPEDGLLSTDMSEGNLTEAAKVPASTEKGITSVDPMDKNGPSANKLQKEENKKPNAIVADGEVEISDTGDAGGEVAVVNTGDTSAEVAANLSVGADSNTVEGCDATDGVQTSVVSNSTKSNRKTRRAQAREAKRAKK